LDAGKLKRTVRSVDHRNLYQRLTLVRLSGH
jgi:hypothetical protein